MPSMTEHQSNSKVNLLLLGPSGGGKTGALASLIDAGLKVRILDFDNGASTLKGFVRDPAKLKNVHYITLRDKLKLVGNRVGVQSAPAFQKAMDALETGKGWDEAGEIKGVTTWGADTVLVIDTLSTAGKASFQMVVQANGHGFTRPTQEDYGIAMDNIERLLDMITSDTINCHVIVNTHTFVNEKDGKTYPEALGSKLPPKVAKPFDNMLSLAVVGGKRTFKTKMDGTMALKSAIPLDDSYPLETGLADIFRKLMGKKDLLA